MKTAPAKSNVLEMRNCAKRYTSFQLRIPELKIEEGSMVGLFGPNGSGKSTLFKVILGMVPLDEGEILFRGQKLPRLPWSHRTCIGYVPDVAALYQSWTVSETVAFVREFYPAWDEDLCFSLMARFQLAPRDKVVHLSHGARTKLLIVLALSRRAPLLLLDEPLAGLDPISRLSVCELFAELRAKSAFQAAVISSHELDEIEAIADRLLFLRHGEIVLDEQRSNLGERYRLVHYSEAAARRVEELPGLWLRRKTVGCRVAVFRNWSAETQRELERLHGEAETEPLSTHQLYLLLYQEPEYKHGSQL
jgi:ABC-2 type transport system ATP-binding protein